MSERFNPYNYGILVISPGDTADTLTILQIKREKIEDPDIGITIQDSICRLSVVMDTMLEPFDDATFERFVTLQNELRAINLTQWDLEDRVRTESSWEAAKAARDNNTLRVSKKNEINQLLGFPVEQKKYKE
jgi:hypothetical protein